VNITARARALAAKTADAYSVSRYASWPACAQVLVTMGLNDLGVEAVLRSKWMRWAADGSSEREGRVPASAIKTALDGAVRGDAQALHRLVDELIVGTFGVQPAVDETTNAVQVVMLAPGMYSFLDAAGHCMCDATPAPHYQRWTQSELHYAETLLLCNIRSEYLYRTYEEAAHAALLWDPGV